MFTADSRGKRGREKNRDLEEGEEEEERGMQRMKALADNMLACMGQAPLLMKGEMKTRDEGRRRKRGILALGRLLSSCYPSSPLIFSPLATTVSSDGGKAGGAVRAC